ncbi:MAG: tRNA pseudouridine(38-40) synthase TruA [Deltaproteobacteria bacterium]|nr:MAG: tRNA pseudouridine(38-40) synthase TruA [Deltaproteobacteria bacterium]
MVVGRIAYDGSLFHGFARQKHTNRTIETRLMQALKAVGIGEKILYAGRTDAKVHAFGQVVAFRAQDFWQMHELKSHLNRLLKNEVFFKSLRRTSDDFHPRFCASSRMYRYLIFTSTPTPFLNNYALFANPDLTRLNEALALFHGEIDLEFFHKTGSNQTNTIRQFFRSFAYKHKDFIVICIEASGFLRASVRLIVSACLAYARSEIKIEQVLAQIKAQKRIITNPVSPNGLYLSRVRYSGKFI